MLPTIDIHTHHPRPGQLSLPNVRIRDEHPVFPASGPYSAGIHPWDTAKAREVWLDTFVSPPAGLAAIGETGLDLRPAYPPLEVQRPWLEAQLQAARRLDLPVILHNVRATAPLQAILSRHSDLTLLLHGFTGSPELVRQWIRQVPTVLFSFGPALMRSPKSQDALRWIATQCPERLFLETDDAPQIDIREMYIFASASIGWETDRLGECLYHNFNTLFPRLCP